MTALSPIALLLTAGCLLSPDQLDDLRPRGSFACPYGMAPMEAHTFDMGCTAGQVDCDGDEAPVTTVTLSYDLCIDQTEVTQGDWVARMGDNPSRFADCDLDCPVDGVTWHDAAAFANERSSEAGLASCYTCVDGLCTSSATPFGCEGFRLPTEAEWEAAARCGQDLLYAGAGSPAAVAWYFDNAGSSTHSVGILSPNGCDLYDMSGNVSEWVHTRYGVYPGGSVEDWTGPEPTGDADMGVLRGGDCSQGESELRVSSRSEWPQAAADPSKLGIPLILGFRLVRTMP